MPLMPRVSRYRREERRYAMKDQPEEKLFSMGQLLLITCVFSVYAITLLSLDPEWVLWAGSMSLGSLYVPDPPPRLFDDPRKALEIASDLFLVGLLGLLCLVGFMGEVKFGWLSWLKARWAEWRSRSARGGETLGDIRAEAHFQEVDRDPRR
jgi:hypothetical protein